MADLTGTTTELLQTMIRNACVNDGSTGSEVANVDTLVSFMEGSGLDFQRYEPKPGRGSVLAKIEGSDPTAPSLMLMGHLDVVPVNAERWERDPFGGELVDGVVWGRGAVDMLNTTSSMAVAFTHLARSGFKPRGTLLFLGVADEEALGTWGAKWLTEHEADDVRCDYVITEFGGARLPLPTPSPKVILPVAEKGTYWCKIVVRGTPGHGSMPYKSDNALVTAAEVVRRLAAYRPTTGITEVFKGFVEGMGFDDGFTKALLDPGALDALIDGSEDLGLARMLEASTHTTFSPNMMRAGVKTNIIPDTVEIEVDIRTLPGSTGEDIRAQLREALGEMYDRIEIAATSDDPSSASPMDTPLWDTLSAVTQALTGATPVPFLIVGATDARYFRRMGITSYGYGMLSDQIPFDQFARMFHGDNERVDVESLRLATELWLRTAESFLA